MFRCIGRSRNLYPLMICVQMFKQKLELLIFRRSISVNSLPNCQIRFCRGRELAVNTMPFSTVIVNSTIGNNPTSTGSVYQRIRITSGNKHHTYHIGDCHILGTATVKDHVLRQIIHEGISCVILSYR